MNETAVTDLIRLLAAFDGGPYRAELAHMLGAYESPDALIQYLVDLLNVGVLYAYLATKALQETMPGTTDLLTVAGRIEKEMPAVLATIAGHPITLNLRSDDLGTARG